MDGLLGQLHRNRQSVANSQTLISAIPCEVAENLSSFLVLGPCFKRTGCDIPVAQPGIGAFPLFQSPSKAPIFSAFSAPLR